MLNFLSREIYMGLAFQKSWEFTFPSSLRSSWGGVRGAGKVSLGYHVDILSAEWLRSSKFCSIPKKSKKTLLLCNFFFYHQTDMWPWASHLLYFFICKNTWNYAGAKLLLPLKVDENGRGDFQRGKGRTKILCDYPWNLPRLGFCPPGVQGF